MTRTVFEAQATPLRSTDALLCVQNSFLLDVGAREALAQQFESLSALTTQVPCFSLRTRVDMRVAQVRGFIQAASVHKTTWRGDAA